MFKYNKIKLALSTLLFMALVFGGLLVSPKVQAIQITCPDGNIKEAPRGITPEDREALCSGNPAPPQRTAPQDQPEYVDSDCPSNGNPELSQDNCGIIKYLVLFIKFLSAIVAIVVVASVIIGGIQYSTSADDPGAVTAAKKRIMNALLALALYVFTFAILQYLVPGGVI